MEGRQIKSGYDSSRSYLLQKETNTILNNISGQDPITYMAQQRRMSGAVISPRQ